MEKRSGEKDSRSKTLSMYPHTIGPIPAETSRIARAGNPKGTLAMWLRDELGAIYRDEEFADLYPQRGQPALWRWRLALVTLVQYVEDMTDRQAAEAVRERIDWKYLLGLELSDPGFDASVLVEWRERLLAQGAQERLLDQVLLVCRERGWLKAGGKMRSDATHVLAAVRWLHHLETVGETLRAVLEELAQGVPDWLLSWMADEWFKRYEARMDSRRLPKKAPQRTQLAEQIGRDGALLLRALERAQTPAVAHFQIDWQGRTARCPQGQLSQSWRERPEREGQIQVSFAVATCRACPVRMECTKGEHRELQLQPQAHAQALQQQRAEQQTVAFRQRYALRSGVEATISQGVRRLPMRQSRYCGMAKVQVQEVVTATALNCLRLYA